MTHDQDKQCLDDSLVVDTSTTPFRVEPTVTRPAPPQIRTCAINASGSSVARASAQFWRITVLPCRVRQMLWTILGMGRI